MQRKRSNRPEKSHILLFVSFIIYLTGCSEESSENNIIDFYFPNRQHEVKIEANEIIISIHDTEPINQIVPIIKVSDKASVTPASNIAQDFTKDVSYTVTAENGDTRRYTVKVRGSSDNGSISFSVPNQTYDVVIDGTDVIIDVYKYVDVSKLTLVVTAPEGAIVDPPSGSSVDFTNPVTYTITTQGGSTTYVITVNKNLSRKNDIEMFELTATEQIFEREGDKLFVYVPYETDITSIATEITVSEGATVNPASGTVIDFTTPQIYTVTASDGTEKSFTVMVKKSPWRKIGNGPFSPRDGAGLVEFKGKMWLIGGWNGEQNFNPITGEYYAEVNDVWNTSNGKDWNFVGNAPWINRHSGGVVVYQDHIWVISGDGFPDVWKTVDGINWEEVTSEAPWGKRYGSTVAVFKDKLWLIGGVDWWNSNGDWVREEGTKAFNDVWSSTDGKNWVKELEFTPFAQRGMIHGYTVWNDELFIVGGGSRAIWPPYAVYNDIWKTGDGTSWTRVTHNAERSPRLHHSTIIYDKKMRIINGTSNSEYLMNDVWYSKNGGIS